MAVRIRAKALDCSVSREARGGRAYRKGMPAGDPHAMPLRDFIAETMRILKHSPEATEICVERVKPLRLAEADGGYEAFFRTFNEATSAAAAG